MAKPPSSDGRLGSLKIHYEYPYYEDLVEPNGALLIHKESHACWHYCVMAHRAINLWAGGAENQIIQYRVGDELSAVSYSTRLEEIARSTAIIYALESPDAFLKTEFKARCWAQAGMLGLGFDNRVFDVAPGKARLH